MPDSPQPRNPVSVLVADDDRGLLKFIEMAFRNAGYAVSTAIDGATAVTAVKQRRFDLLVLDILMPGATGWEVLEAAIAETPVGGKLPRAILVTGFNQEYVVDFSLLQKEGVGAMLLKPFTPQTLVDEAARVLEGPAKVARASTPASTPAL